MICLKIFGSQTSHGNFHIGLLPQRSYIAQQYSVPKSSPMIFPHYHRSAPTAIFLFTRKLRQKFPLHQVSCTSKAVRIIISLTISVFLFVQPSTKNKSTHKWGTWHTVCNVWRKKVRKLWEKNVSLRKSWELWVKHILLLKELSLKTSKKTNRLIKGEV